MNSIINEMILKDYYFSKAIFGKYLDGESFIYCLSENYMLSKKDEKDLFSKAKSVTGIESVGDYYRYLRIRQFLNINGSDADKKDDELITIKGCALELAEKYKLSAGKIESVLSIFNKIYSPQNANLIPLMRIKGIMLCEGILFKQDMAQGIKLLSKAARWNDLASLMPLIRYGKEARTENINSLYTLADGTIYENLVKQTCDCYKVKETKHIEECRILDKVFQAGSLKSDTYDSLYADILYSKTLNKSDREKLLLNGDKKIIARLKNLPLKLSAKYPINFDSFAFDNLPLKRDSEINGIRKALNNVDLCTNEDYRPICLYSESKYVLDTYLNIFKTHFIGAKVERISVADLSSDDLINSDNNIFVRNCSDKEANIYLLDFRGNINQMVAESVVGFLHGARRKRFYLKEMDVTVDLSSILPICFSDKQNYRLLKDHCEMLELCKLDKNEQETAILGLINDKVEVYGMDSLEFSRETMERFKTMDIDAVEKVMDRAVSNYRTAGKSLVISDEMMSVFWNFSDTDIFGFGRKTI